MKHMIWNKGRGLVSKLLFPQFLPSLLNTSARFSPQSRPHQSRERMIQITVAGTDVARLRQVVMLSCGECISFMRLSPLDHARRMQLCLCMEAQAVTRMMEAVMGVLPQAEFNLRRGA